MMGGKRRGVFWVAALALAVLGLILFSGFWTRDDATTGLDGSAAQAIEDAAGRVRRTPRSQSGATQVEVRVAEPAESPSTEDPEPAELAAADHEPGALEITVALPDGIPTPRRRIRITPYAGPGSPAFRSREGVTNRDGIVRFDGLDPGLFNVQCVLGPQENVEVRSGEVTRALLAMRGSVTLTFVVEDERGAGIPRAEIRTSGSEMSELVAVTRADGTCRLTGYSGEPRRFFAQKMGFSPSIVASTGPLAPRSNQPIRFVLARGGCRLAGSVADESGEAVGDAILTVESSLLIEGTENAWEAPARRRVAVRGNGAYAVDGLRPGKAVITVNAPGFMQARREIGIAGETVLDVRLERGAVVSGRVTDRDGNPVAGVYVGQTGLATRGLGARCTSSDATGSFTLEGLPAAPVTLIAMKAGIGRVTEDVVPIRGRPLAWNPVLEAGRGVRGTLLDHERTPLAGWFLHARSMRTIHGKATWAAGARTDENGRFALTNCPAGGVELSILDPTRNCVDRIVDIEVDGPRVILLFDRRRLGQIAGRIDSSVAGWRNVNLLLEGVVRLSRFPDSKTASFSFREIPPGAYTLTGRNGEGEVIIKRPVNLLPGASLDLGLLR